MGFKHMPEKRVVAGVLLLVNLLVVLWVVYTTSAQEPKRFQYKVVDSTADTQTLQAILNDYGNAGWELVAVAMGDIQVPRLIFKK
ncbi:MAG TPA: hypothetical protein VNK46_16090 [Nitrospiraceae bacterium]|jgi:hypothetical protein|nr:hypothetical protein [Nitrospiraceae bacterium]